MQALEPIHHTGHKVDAGLLQPSAAVVVANCRFAAPIVIPVAHPSTEAILMVQQVVYNKLCLYFIAVLQMPGIGCTHVEKEVGVDSIAFASGIVGILLAYIFAYQLYLAILDGSESGDGGTYY